MQSHMLFTRIYMDKKIIGSLLPTEADLAFSWNTGRRSCTWVLVHGIGLVCTSKCSTYISHTYSTNHNIMVATQHQQKKPGYKSQLSSKCQPASLPPSSKLLWFPPLYPTYSFELGCSLMLYSVNTVEANPVTSKSTHKA